MMTACSDCWQSLQRMCHFTFFMLFSPLFHHSCIRHFSTTSAQEQWFIDIGCLSDEPSPHSDNHPNCFLFRVKSPLLRVRATKLQHCGNGHQVNQDMTQREFRQQPRYYLPIAGSIYCSSEISCCVMDSPALVDPSVLHAPCKTNCRPLIEHADRG